MNKGILVVVSGFSTYRAYSSNASSSISFSNSSLVRKKYSLPSSSPGRGFLVVAETDNA